jgi:NADP-dependent 3-hydroxy acid dehydrogenase YdfG
MTGTSYDLSNWKGRTALVTGASAGIGRAVALNLAKAGLRVAACARRFDRLEALRVEVAEAGGELLPLQADLRKPGEITVMFERIRQEWEGIDVLINNAGLGHSAPLVSGETEAWREMLEVNVLALCVCTREAIKDMHRRGVNGHVIHISSMAGHRVPEGSGVYAATKHAVKALTEALRGELRAEGSPVRVTAISPGFVETEFAYVYHQDEERAKKTYTQFKVLDAENIADAVAYALSQPAHVQVHDILMRPTQQKS